MGKRKYWSEELCCIVTGMAGVDLHHVKTQGSGGTDDPWNLMPLRHLLHVEAHQIGLTRFSEKYPKVREWLLQNGWTRDPVLLRWIHAPAL